MVIGATIAAAPATGVGVVCAASSAPRAVARIAPRSPRCVEEICGKRIVLLFMGGRGFLGWVELMKFSFHCLDIAEAMPPFRPIPASPMTPVATDLHSSRLPPAEARRFVEAGKAPLLRIEGPPSIAPTFGSTLREKLRRLYLSTLRRSAAPPLHRAGRFYLTRVLTWGCHGCRMSRDWRRGAMSVNQNYANDSARACARRGRHSSGAAGATSSA